MHFYLSVLAVETECGFSQPLQTPPRLVLPPITGRLRVHSFPSLTLHDLAIPALSPAPSTKKFPMPPFARPLSCSRPSTGSKRMIFRNLSLCRMTPPVS